MKIQSYTDENMPVEVMNTLSFIYNAACQVAEYYFSKKPNFFKLTNFSVDKFHSITHTGDNIRSLHHILIW